MNLEKTIAFNVEECRQNIKSLQRKIDSMPPGCLSISSGSNGYFSWRVVNPDGSRIYLPKSEESTARALAKKKLYQAQIHDMEAEIKASERYLRCKRKYRHATEALYTNSGKEFQRLIADAYVADDARARLWENEPYEKSNKYPQQLTIPTMKEGEFVRSKIEAIVAGQLYELGIPYKYEKITKIGSWDVAVDFTALDLRNYNEILIEIFGLMDNPEYRKSHDRKLNNYINNGFIPGVNLLTFYESSKTGFNIMFLHDTLKKYFFDYPPMII